MEARKWIATFWFLSAGMPDVLSPDCPAVSALGDGTVAAQGPDIAVITLGFDLENWLI
jgi:hypothetical protein